MKFRNGFVSNSSSCGFVVGLQKKPESVEELQKIFFGDEEYYFHPYQDDDENIFWTTAKIAGIVFKDMKEVSNAEAVEEINDGWIDEVQDDPVVKNAEKLWRQTPWDDSQYKERMEEYNCLCREKSEELLDNFLRKNELWGKFMFTVTYADNDGILGCAMEHGGLFDKVPHIRCSRH